MSRWMMAAKRADFGKLASKYGIDQVIARIMVNRGVAEDDFYDYLHPDVTQIRDPHDLLDVGRACDLLKDAIDAGEKIRIIGDYDIDGIMSTYILQQALIRCKASVSFDIPDRIADGYGVNPRMVERAAADGVSLIITCDNGIAAMDAVTCAKQAGMTVIVTDHHEVPYRENEDGSRKEILPPADAIVNPHREGDPYPFPDICGAVVAWKLVFVLYEKCGIPVTEGNQFLEYAAFATVGDVMDLKDENRAIVSLGLDRLRQTKNYGMRALILQQGIDPDVISAYHIGFVLGPCFNASGRLETAKMGIALLEAEDMARASSLASQLAALNNERKSMTQEGVDQALAQMEEKHYDRDSVIVIYLPKLHESLVGIVAGRIREKYNRPAFVLCDAETGNLVKGSGRSIEAYSMYEELVKCRDLLVRFGGHPMAAGLSLEREKVDDFRRALNRNAALTEEDLTPVIHIDVPMPIGYITFDLVNQLSLLEPFGKGNVKPVFAEKNVPVLSARRIGREGQYLKLRLASGHGPMDALYFGSADDLEALVVRRFGISQWSRMMDGSLSDVKLTITYYPQINRYQGHESLQIVIGEVC